MNIPELLKAVNQFRGRKFLIVLAIWYLVYIGKVDQYWAGVATLAYFLFDMLEKYLVHKSEDESACPEKKDGQ